VYKNYPPHTSWEIKDIFGKVLISRDPVIEFSETTELCLSHGTYVFIIYDTEGDGFQYYNFEDYYDDLWNLGDDDGAPEGYTLSVDGEIIKGGNFAYLEVTTFYILPPQLYPSSNP